MENEFGAGKVLSQSVDVMKSNFPVMLLFAALSYIPSLVGNITGQSSALGTGLSAVLGYFLPLLLQGAMVYGVYQFLTGSPFSASRSFNMALGRFWYLLGLALIIFVLSLIGFVFLVIPGIIINLVLWVAIPAVMIEKVSIGDAMGRSKDLTSGRLWRILGLLFILSLFYILLSVVNITVYYALGAFSLDPEAMNEAMSLTALLIATPVGILTVGLGSAFFGVVVSVSYYALRRDKDGIGVEDLASVFD